MEINPISAYKIGMSSHLWIPFIDNSQSYVLVFAKRKLKNIKSCNRIETWNIY